MGRRRNGKIITIVALVVAIVGMSIGFAAFSTTLNISSSASVTPNSSDFKLQFSSVFNDVDSDGSCTTVAGYGYGGASGSINCMKENSISDMRVSFTEPGQYVEFRLFIHNTGEYDAYLKSINWNNIVGEDTTIKCEASTTGASAATPSLVQEACDWIGIVYDYNGVAYSFGQQFSDMKLSKGSSAYIDIYVAYNGDYRVDGPMDVTFGDITLEYSTVDNSTIFYFTFDGRVFAFEEGMTWEEWIHTDYNNDGFYISGDYVCSGYGEMLSGAKFDDVVREESYANGDPCKTN